MAPTPAVPARVLVIRLGAIGDVANALVFASALRAARPDIHIGWVTHDQAYPVVDGHPDVNRTFLWKRSRGSAALPGLISKLRAERYDLVVDLQRILKSAFLARSVRTQRTLGFDRRRAKEGSWLLHREHIAAGDPTAHMVEQYLEFAAHLGAAGPAVHRLPADHAAEQAAEKRVAELGGAPILIQLGANKVANRWPAERFGQLAARLTDLGPVCLCGGPDDRELGTRALAAVPKGLSVHDLVDRTNLSEWIALARRSRVFIGCDTGPMHLAAATNLPVIALFGPANPRRTGPYGHWDPGSPHRVLRTDLPCSPCGNRTCARPSREGPRDQCMTDLTIEQVEQAARAAC